ncbi:MAG: hypothetical protein KJO24_07285, partial [Gammaproteobacteria bacterium]|nr:hypothetical protein [Gammaproteobacteria bacterium]
SAVYARFESFFSQLEDNLHYSDLLQAAATRGNADLHRLCYEYLPLTFSRRHGDPSRPWNKFAIELKNPDGSKLLNFQGNWRDIFQNWEALSFSIPNFVESIICKFVNATTADGNNPYRITKNGIDWEELDPTDPWSNIGYWGDHQIIYLLKFLEFSSHHHPGTLKELLNKDIFCYANVPYSIKSYADLLDDPRNTIDYDERREQLINQRVEQVGSDGRLLWSTNDTVLHVNLTEKLLATVLSKLTNFIPEGGIWLNTQRPEWNDANNALVGYGVSMVTLYYTRRFAQYMLDLLSTLDAAQIAVSTEIAGLFDAVQGTLEQHKNLLDGAINDRDRKRVVDQLGQAGSDFRQQLYAKEISGERTSMNVQVLTDFFTLSLAYIDHSIRANKRDDGLYHAYNLMHASDDSIQIKQLYEMLEGQVAVLSSGYLSAEESVQVLSALKQSSMYTERQRSYLLYPDRQLPRFVDKNIIPEARAKKSKLFQALLANGDHSLVERDAAGEYHFNGRFKNVDDAREVMQALKDSGYAELVAAEQGQVEDMFEDVFNHIAFTGRSGGMYAYEGLGSIYWHMVSKLLLAVQETYQRAVSTAADARTTGKLVEFYYDIRAGIGFNKTPEEYGAFPTDPYSHTPGFAGARQPGMTGQVKEEIITRLVELGVVVEQGRITFTPVLLRKSEFLARPAKLEYFDIDGRQQTLTLAQGQLGFTYCQVPVVYSIAKQTRITLTLADGKHVEIDGNAIDADTSMLIFDKKQAVARIDVALKPGLQ